MGKYSKKDYENASMIKELVMVGIKSIINYENRYASPFTSRSDSDLELALLNICFGVAESINYKGVTASFVRDYLSEASDITVSKNGVFDSSKTLETGFMWQLSTETVCSLLGFEEIEK